MNETRLAEAKARRPDRRVARRADRFRLPLATLALTGLTACVTPTGDFGRAAPGEAAYAYAYRDDGAVARTTRRAGELFDDLTGLGPAPGVPFTDEERQMQDRVWRFVVAPHARAWMFDPDIQPRRQTVPLLMTAEFDPGAYVDWLRAQDYRSSTIRFRTVADHVEADLATLPAAFGAICAVQEMSQRRRVALAEIRPADAAVAAGVTARERDNADFENWFVRALTARADAYQMALDRLLVETPHEEARLVNDGLNKLAPWVARAERADFCPPLALPEADRTLGFGGPGMPPPRRLYAEPEFDK